MLVELDPGVGVLDGDDRSQTVGRLDDTSPDLESLHRRGSFRSAASDHPIRTGSPPQIIEYQSVNGPVKFTRLPHARPPSPPPIMLRMARPVHIIGVPLDLGGNRRGVDMGPSAFRIAGIGERLTALGIAVVDAGDLVAPIP